MSKTFEDVLENAIQNTIDTFSWPRETSHDFESIVEALKELLTQITVVRYRD